MVGLLVDVALAFLLGSSIACLRCLIAPGKQSPRASRSHAQGRFKRRMGEKQTACHLCAPAGTSHLSVLYLKCPENTSLGEELSWCGALADYELFRSRKGDLSSFMPLWAELNHCLETTRFHMTVLRSPVRNRQMAYWAMTTLTCWDSLTNQGTKHCLNVLLSWNCLSTDSHNNGDHASALYKTTWAQRC